ncbi:MAG: hypothetical protein Q9173_002635 [Seirophora scorigena]
MTSKAENDAGIETDGLVISDYVHPHSVHAGVPIEEIEPPPVGKDFEVDEAVLDDPHCGIIPFDSPGEQMCQGELESLKAMYAVVPTFIPEVYKWGHLKSGPAYFVLAEFRQVGQQPPDPPRFTMRVAELHYNSKSPNGKFGFHVPTFHGNLPTYTDWEASWTVMYTKILGRAMDIDQSKSDPGPAFAADRRLLFDYVIPRLLHPLPWQE